MPLVSIIMPAYNAAKYISEAIESVLEQSHQNWELLVVNDGSRDKTQEKVLAFDDDRIRYFSQENKGVSAARNVGLNNMKGAFFCFLDADDVYPPHSLSERLKVFQDYPEVHFVDGLILIKDERLEQLLEVRQMSFDGPPFDALVRLDETCFMGITWMIRRVENRYYQLDENLTHSEDLNFFIDISAQGTYKAVSTPILQVRRGHISAIQNLKGLEHGYLGLLNNIKQDDRIRPEQWSYLKKRIARIMFLSYLRKGRVIAALRAGISFLSF